MARADEYGDYVSRFEDLLGRASPGDYRKHEGRLIKRLSAAEFAEAMAQLTDANDTYAAIMERGDTVSDALIRLIRERAAELVTSSPI